MKDDGGKNIKEEMSRDIYVLEYVSMSGIFKVRRSDLDKHSLKHIAVFSDHENKREWFHLNWTAETEREGCKIRYCIDMQ